MYVDAPLWQKTWTFLCASFNQIAHCNPKMFLCVTSLMWWKCANLSFIGSIMIHMLSLDTQFFMSLMFFNHSFVRICQWISVHI
jgi:hypothetical protein